MRIAEFSLMLLVREFFGFLIFMALISINLGLVNLITTRLDGGHLFFTIEA